LERFKNHGEKGRESSEKLEQLKMQQMANNRTAMKLILPVIVIAQFLCTSLWFAGNAIIPDLINHFNINENFVANITSAVQFGFIMGTLVFALLTIADRFSPSLVFFCCSIIAALFNGGLSVEKINLNHILIFRFFTGFFLAGIYPVGMKIASDYFQKGLGKSLGFLVGALVIGTAFPHLLKNIIANFPWKYVILSTSVLSCIGGAAMFFLVPNGPFRKPAQQFNSRTFLTGFRNKNFRLASFGYFGHMWELYSFWTFVPIMLTAYKNYYPAAAINIPLLSFLIIASGGVACVCSGLLSQYFSTSKIATMSLLLSCLCCCCSPLFLFNKSVALLIGFLFFWGITVIADSPLFSTLVAQNAPEQSKGTSLTIVNCIGFSITIVSIQLIKIISDHISPVYIYTLLASGPILGLIAMRKYKDG
jgi:MFS family permease